MDYKAKFIYQSNAWYNDGLQKAKIRDLSGAIASLRRSLQFNRENITARNLLGLVYYGRGEVVEALVEWIISKNIKSHENVAGYFIKKVQETPSELETINQAVHKYNQCLSYCQQNGEDLAVIQLKKVITAHPTFLKAYQLLALLYIQTEQYAKARQMLRRAAKLDTTDDITLQYVHELNAEHKKKAKSQRSSKKPETVTYTLGNETIIQPASSLRDNSGVSTMVNVIIGLLLGAAVIWFLVVPAVNQAKTAKENKEALAYSEQLETKKGEINALKKELEQYRVNSEAAEAAQKDAAAAQQSYETLLNIQSQYSNGNISNADVADGLLGINKDVLGENGASIYNNISGEVFPIVCSRQYRDGQASYDSGDYAAAIAAFEKVILMNEEYQEGQGLLALANAYAKSGDQEKANEKYNRVIELYPNTDQAAMAQAGINGEVAKTSGSVGNSDNEDSDTGDNSSDEEDYNEGSDDTDYNNNAEDEDNTDSQDNEDTGEEE